MSSSRLPDFIGSEISGQTPENSLFHVVPVPYEKTVSYGHGTADGPRALLEASWQLEAFDGLTVPAEEGIFTLDPIDCSGDAEQVLSEIGRTAAGIVEKKKIPVLLGGEHTITFGAVRALRQAGISFGVVQFDAHADLRDTYEGTPLSHACVMRRISELDVPIFQVGVRSLSEPEVKYRASHKIASMDAVPLATGEDKAFRLPSGFPRNVYITVDVDVLDAALMPATGTPEPGGVDWYPLMSWLTRTVENRRVIAADVVELAPISGLHAPNFTAARLTYNLMGIIARNI